MGGSITVRGLEGKRIIVASGATGIGAATARRLAEEGARVLVGDVNESGLTETVERLSADGGIVQGKWFDLADERSIEALVSACVDCFGGIDGLVNVGAEMEMARKELGHDLLDMNIADWQRTLRVNLVGHALTIGAAIPHLVAAGGGAIVGVSSAAAQGGFADQPAYAASKAGLNALARHVARRWGKDNIRCNYIAPGWILSEAALRYLEQHKDRHEEAVAALPLTRLGRPEDTAALIAFLLSDDGAWITGQVVAINGGAAFRE
jgi:NAD(P)-dependent dehydrogenase (short-subunit alcohol dehydrogenase family)